MFVRPVEEAGEPSKTESSDSFAFGKRAGVIGAYESYTRKFRMSAQNNVQSLATEPPRGDIDGLYVRPVTAETWDGAPHDQGPRFSKMLAG